MSEAPPTSSNAGDVRPHTDATRIQITVGSLSFVGRLETHAAPRTVVWLTARLPLRGTAFHARWSGEAGWMPLGDVPQLAPENATTYPQPGQILLYAGSTSEPELLIPYGACAFASRAGMLAGNHVMTLECPVSSLQKLGDTLLRHGAQPLHLITT